MWGHTPLITPPSETHLVGRSQAAQATATFMGLELVTGVEPATLGVQNRCSAN